MAQQPRPRTGFLKYSAGLSDTSPALLFMDTGLRWEPQILPHPSMPQKWPVTNLRVQGIAGKKTQFLGPLALSIAMLPDCLKLSQTFLQVCTQCLLNLLGLAKALLPPPPGPPSCITNPLPSNFRALSQVSFSHPHASSPLPQSVLHRNGPPPAFPSPASHPPHRQPYRVS